MEKKNGLWKIAVQGEFPSKNMSTAAKILPRLRKVPSEDFSENFLSASEFELQFSTLVASRIAS